MTSLNSSEPHVRWTLVVGDTDTDAGHNDDNANDDAISASIIHHHDNTHPRRPRAPTPSPPPFYSSSSSSSSEDGDSNDNQEESPTSGTQSPLRGRPRSLLGENHNLVSRATARRRAGPSSIDFSELLRPAGTFALPLPTPAFPEEQPLPMLYLSTPTVNEVLSHASTMNSVTGVDLSTFGGHRDTFAMLDLQCLPWPAVELPFAVFVRLDSFLDAESYFALRLTCRCWSAALTAVHPPSYKFSAAQRSPTELLHLIYADLEPVDFNAARRVCRGWMMAGLEGGLLEEMLRKGGWWAGLLADREVRREGRRGSVGVEWEWVMSKRLSTECALGRGWTGCGFSDGEESTDAVMLETEGGTARPGIKLTARTDFSELASAVTSGEQDSALQFTVSLCGKFLLVAEGCVIYVYQLCETDRRGSTPTFTHGGSLEYFTSIVCPKKVLAVSMDTSSRRFAVATLLNDRTGMVCDLDPSRLTVRNDEIQRQRKSIWGPELSKMDASPSPEPSNSNPTTQPPTPGDANNVQFQSYPVFEHPQVNHVAYHVAPLPLNTPVPQSIISTSALSNRPAPLNPRSIYRSLCSLTDPPLSVAICPQRRCVAFGCSSGIELHWVDALTGQDLNRWFPLTAPSDFLYFLPPRRGVDSAKKLRLISSAGCAGQRGSLRNRFEGGWGAEESAWWREDGRTRWETEHWRAVPLGDGEMALYTDPETGLLALGGDTPMRGPTRLERSFMFKGPVGAVPTVYAAGSELRWGLRVVVGYEDSLWLFCVPPDTFGEEKERRKRSVVPGAVEEAREGPTLIQGTEIGKVEGLLDVAVDSSGGSLTVWAFAAGGMAYTYQLDDGNSQRLRKRAVQRDGVVLDLEDADGDVIMRDAPPVFHPTDFDGTYSLSGYSARPSISSLADADMTRATDRIVNPVTEVEMRDEDEGYWSSDEGSPARGTFAIHVPPLEGRWSVEEEAWEWDVDYLGVGVEMGMDLMEMGRLECEVL